MLAKPAEEEKGKRIKNVSLPITGDTGDSGDRKK